MNKSLIFIPLVALLLSGCTSKGGKRKSGGGGGSTAHIDADDPEGFEYYTSRYRNKKDCFGNPVEDYYFYNSYGDDLADQIHNYCVDQHKTFINYTSNPYASLFGECDKAYDENGNAKNGRITYFYTAKEMSRGSGNREHVWPCANSGGLWWRSSEVYEHQIDNGHAYWGGGSDIYNLHACDGTVNSDRGNAKFTVFASTSGMTTSNDGGPYSIYISSNGKKVQADPKYRGNIARIIMYMWCHYSFRGDRNIYYPKNYESLKPVYNIDDAVEAKNGHNPNMCAVLSLTDILDFYTKEEMYAALKQWNEEDPPDEQEKHANDYVEAHVQGNRNPFIDYPQLVGQIVDHLDY